MKILSAKFKDKNCFRSTWAGLDEFKPITVVIGKNNSGKSYFMRFIEYLCTEKNKDNYELEYSTILTEALLKKKFVPRTRSDPLSGDLWSSHGQYFIGAKVIFLDSSEKVSISGHRQKELPPWDNGEVAEQDRLIIMTLRGEKNQLSEKIYRTILADRDIAPEQLSNSEELRSNGAGATNIIRRFLTSSSDKWDRDVIQKNILSALNRIFGTDGEFTELAVKHHESHDDGISTWEIYLGEKHKGLIPLSSSGSGLKTILLVLLNLIAIPHLERKSLDNYVFSFEELENNLHPAVQRRLLKFLEEYATSQNTMIFLTTHSNIALDIFGSSKNAQIIRVHHDGESAHTTTVSDHFAKLDVLSELGAKPSDLLQANGVIWVEGPSDRVYLNRWIELMSDGLYKEGRDYQCAIYGGALLGSSQFTSEEESNPQLINLFKLNSNFIVVCDSDKDSPQKRLKPRVCRVRDEVKKNPRAHIWITDAKEIENYIPGDVIAATRKSKKNIPSPGKFDQFFAKEKADNTSFFENNLGIQRLDKTDFALACIPFMTIDNMSSRFDWETQVKTIIQLIKEWNS